MTVSRRQKLFIILLLIYWPVIFILAHIPIPPLVRDVGVSDKSIHFTAYLLLVFLFWSAISPDSKVNWRRAAPWLVLVVMVCYGVMDELLQSVVVGRSCDIRDFFADLAGVLTGLTIFTFFSFWPAFLVVTGITILTLVNLTRVNLAEFLHPAANAAFYLVAFGFFAGLWFQNLQLFMPLKAQKPKWLIAALALPMGFLVALKLLSIISGRDFRLQDFIIAAAGIAAVVITVYLVALFRARRIRASIEA